MVYARFASGYRPGGPNTNTQIAALPAEFGPDKTQNYEIGVKGTLLDRALSFDASLYYIDWKQIQILLRDSGFSFRANGSRAKSQGVEVSIESRPMSGTVIAAWVAWNQAELTEELPTTSTVVGLAGDRLPNSARISGSISLDQEIPLTSSVQGFVGGTVSYVGDRLDVFSASSQRQIFPAYARSDLRAGMRFADWTLNVFVNNVADRRGVLTKANFPNSFFYIQPRTAGLALSRVF
jgi:outer membrane receptor protein involved in Fe transport